MGVFVLRWGLRPHRSQKFYATSYAVESHKIGQYVSVLHQPTEGTLTAAYKCLNRIATICCNQCAANSSTCGRDCKPVPAGQHQDAVSFTVSLFSYLEKKKKLVQPLTIYLFSNP